MSGAVTSRRQLTQKVGGTEHLLRETETRTRVE